MKYSTLLLASMLCLAPTAGFAQESKTDKISADQSVQKSQRKAILGLSHLALEAKQFAFPVYYTPAGENAKTRRLSDWNVRIDQDYADQKLAHNYSMLISNRYDKMVFNKDGVSISTPIEDINSELGGVAPFSFDTGSYKSFQKALDTYLNGQIAKKVQGVLSSAMESRFSQMDEAQADTFIQSKAKESGIPAPILEKLMNSSFSFSVFLPKVKGEISISQVAHKTDKGTYYTYTTKLLAPLDTMLQVHKFDGKAFSSYSEVNSDAGMDPMANAAKNSSGSKSISTKNMPTVQHAQALFDSVFNLSLKDTLLAINTRLKEDRNFAIIAPIDTVEGSTVTTSIGNQEDIRVDHPMKVMRTVDGVEKQVGVLKMRDVGLNCALLPIEKQTTSTGSMIFGGAEMMDLAVELGWTGVFGTFGVVSTLGNYDFTDATATLGEYASSGLFETVDTTSGATNMISVEFEADLGYVMNASGLSEIWMNMGGAFGMASSDGSLPRIYLDNVLGQDAEAGMAFKVMLGFEKRLYPMSNLVIGLGADMGFDAASYTYTTNSAYYDSASLTLASMHLVPRVKAIWAPSVKLDLYTSLGYNVPFGTSGSYSLSDGDSETDDPSMTFTGVSRTAGLNIAAGLSYHIDFAGPFAAMFSRPSSMCDNLKKQRAAEKAAAANQ